MIPFLFTYFFTESKFCSGNWSYQRSLHIHKHKKEYTIIVLRLKGKWRSELFKVFRKKKKFRSGFFGTSSSEKVLTNLHNKLRNRVKCLFLCILLIHNGRERSVESFSKDTRGMMVPPTVPFSFCFFLVRPWGVLSVYNRDFRGVYSERPNKCLCVGGTGRLYHRIDRRLDVLRGEFSMGDWEFLLKETCPVVFKYLVIRHWYV